jgi:thiamine biosynthesis lipoprotein
MLGRAGGALAAVLVCAFAGCEGRGGPTEAKRAREVMGTFAEVTAVGADRETANRAAEAAYARLDDVNRLMSDYVADSEIGRLNALSAGESLVVSPETFFVLERAAAISKRSGGAFDVTCRPLVWLWKAAGESGQLPSDAEIAAAKARIGWAKLALDPATRTVTVTVDGMQVDLGGIAKGYALDLAAEAMQAAGAAGGLVNVGGDVVAFGERRSGGPWIIGIRDPFGSGVFGKLALADCAVATSGAGQRFSIIEGRRYSHIIDPRTGWPAAQAPSVTVIAPDGITADAWATVFSVLSVKEGQALAKTLDGIEVLWIWGSADEPKTARTHGFDAFRQP